MGKMLHYLLQTVESTPFKNRISFDRYSMSPTVTLHLVVFTAKWEIYFRYKNNTNTSGYDASAVSAYTSFSFSSGG